MMFKIWAYSELHKIWIWKKQIAKCFKTPQLRASLLNLFCFLVGGGRCHYHNSMMNQLPHNCYSEIIILEAYLNIFKKLWWFLNKTLEQGLDKFWLMLRHLFSIFSQLFTPQLIWATTQLLKYVEFSPTLFEQSVK